MEAVGGGVSALPSSVRPVLTEMNLPFVPCPEGMTYQRRLAALLATWRREKVAPTILEAAFSGLDVDWSIS